MALSIKDDETERLARELAARRGTPMTSVIRSALRRETQRNEQDGEEDELRFDVAVRRAQQMVRGSGFTWLATRDEMLGYDEFGVPEQR